MEDVQLGNSLMFLDSQSAARLQMFLDSQSAARLQVLNGQPGTRLNKHFVWPVYIIHRVNQVPV